MPRLTSNQYLIERDFLTDLWQEVRPVYAFLTYDDQMTLHQFFAPTKNLTDRVAIAHRQSVAKQHPSLPQRAGKIYVQIDFYARAMQKVIAEQPAQPVELKTKAIAKPAAPDPHSSPCQPRTDLRRLTRALMAVAEDKQAEKNDHEQGRAA